MKRKNATVGTPAQLCSNALGQQIIYRRRSLRDIEDTQRLTSTSALDSPRVHASIHKAQVTLDELLMQTVFRRRIPQIARLIMQGADVDTLRDGLSPLLWAVEQKDVEMVAFLLAQGAKPSIRGSFNNTPLHIAALSHSPKAFKIAQLLIMAHADVNAQNDLGQTPLHIHGKKGAAFLRFAKLLLSSGARLDLVDIKGNEPLGRLSQKLRDELMRFSLFQMFNRS